MAHINRPDIPAGYFHASGDVEKTATARRASFNPSLSNRITNKLAQTDRPKLARFVNSVRAIDLSLREQVNTRRLSGARERFEALTTSHDASPEQKRAGQADVDRLAHKALRLESKQMLGEMARAGVLEDGARQLTEAHQEHLRESGFEPLHGLTEARQTRVPSSSLLAPDGHRITVNASKPPLVPRLVGKSVSADYDRGRSGINRALRSAMQHALVGVYSAEQSIKGMVTGHLANSARLDEGARARMAARTERTGQNRTIARDSLGGNVTLDNSFRVAVKQQIASAEARLTDPNGPRYTERDSVAGRKPPQVRAWERYVDAYFQPRPAATPAPGSATPAPDAPPARRGAPILRFAVKLANLHDKASHAWHVSGAKRAASGLENSTDDAGRARLGQSQARHDTGAAKAEYRLKVRPSALQGQLLRTLDDPATRQLLDTAFPASDDAPADERDPRTQR